MELMVEDLKVGDVLLAAGHPGHKGFAGGTVTHVVEAFGHIFELRVVGAKNINPGGRMKDLIKNNATFTVKREG